MKGRYILIALSFILLTSARTLKHPASDKIEWMTLEEAVKRAKENHKPILIDLYTDWCHWCKVMDKDTYENKGLVSYVNDKYYNVRLNAETRDTIQWMGHSFFYDPQYKINTFALYITDNQPSFPTAVILADDRTAPIAMSGYLKAKEMELMVKFIGEGAYKKEAFQAFQHTFHASW